MTLFGFGGVVSWYRQSWLVPVLEQCSNRLGLFLKVLRDR